MKMLNSSIKTGTLCALPNGRAQHKHSFTTPQSP